MGYLFVLEALHLRNNTLRGEAALARLAALVSLNVSRNRSSGLISDKIGELKELEVLDLSHNQISGKIPSSLADIDRLGTLDLSHNRISGKIPKCTPSVYLGNPGLSGCSLSTKCSGDNDECLND